MYDNIPEELKALPQWVCAGEDKAPRIPGSTAFASVIDPTTWRSFDQAVAGGWPNIGFVFTKGDPYVLIDLDNKEGDPLIDMNHQQRINDLQSYTERSMSGKGYHVIVRGELPRAYKTKSFELYDTERYAVFTGNLVLPCAIENRQAFLEKLVPAEPLPQTILISTSQTLTDQEVMDKAAGAANGDKFRGLWMGDWRGLGYPSQSEADYALVDLLMFYSKDVDQTIRMFRMSTLGQRDKANDRHSDKYLGDMARKAYQLVVPPVIDFTQFKANLPPPPAPTRKQDIHYPDPPGTLYLLQDYIFHTSTMPIREISMVGALSFMSGLVGRQYNISRTGLNLYFLLLGDVGVGKEGAKKGVTRTIRHVAESLRIPEVTQFMGPGEIASGVALLRYLADCHFKCFLSVISEFGEKLSHITSGRANPAEQQINRVLLDLYNESGRDDYISDTVYSDIGKNIPRVKSPAVSFLGVSTPSSLFGAIRDEQIRDGLISRFTLVYYRGDRVPLNAAQPYPMSPALEAKLAELVQTVITMYRNETHCDVQMTHEAKALMDGFEEEIRMLINACPKEATARYVWNRAHLKALRLAGIAAAADNPKEPTVTLEHATWAVEFTRMDAHSMLLGLETESNVNAAGVDGAQLRDCRRVIRAWLYDEAMYASYEKRVPTAADLRKAQLIPRGLLSDACLGLTSFSRGGGVKALDNVLASMVKDGELVAVSPAILQQQFKTTAAAYAITDSFPVKAS